jgi:serine/threonine protein kinase
MSLVYPLKNQLGRGGFGPVYLVILNFYGETVTHLYLSPSPTFYSISTWLPSLRNVAVDQGRLDDGRRVAVKQLSVRIFCILAFKQK